MSRIHCCAAAALLLAATSASAEHYRLYLIGGQSNANGRGDASQLTEPLASPQPDVRFYWHRTQATDNTGHLVEDKWIDLAPGSGHGKTSPVYPKEFGLEVSCGRRLADAYPGEKIAIIKYSHGGSNLHTQWAQDGPMYQTFIATTKAAQKALTAEGHTYELQGMIWQQGEADAGSQKHAGHYESRLTSLISRVRTDLCHGQPLPFVIGGLSDSQNSAVKKPNESWYIVRQAQETVARTMPKVGFVNTDGLPTRIGEAIHFNHEGLVALGKAHAAKLVSLAGDHGQTSMKKPNIVFILADDLGIGDVHCYGRDRCLIDTPNLDALAAGGLRFTDAHPSASVCGPTRRALMTGRYDWRFGSTVNDGPWGFVGPRPHTEDSTLGKLLKRSGYRTGYVGKWHLGTTMTTLDGKTQNLTNVDFRKPLTYGPVQFGFDESFILPGSLDMYPYAFARNNVWQGEITAQKGWSAFNRIGPAEKDFEDHEVLATFYSEAESFIAKQNSDDPFFLFLALTAPHTPTSPGAGWQGKSKLGVYGDFVMEVDHSVERVMTALKAKGLDQNTLVLFSSDHGPGPYAGNILKATPAQIKLLEAKGHFPSGPHRGYKFSVYEGGLRVPLIAWWPGVIPEATTCDALVGLNDLMATFAELTDAGLNDNEAPDSISFAGLLRDPSAEGIRQDLIMQSVGAFVLRSRDWKLCLCPGSGTPAGSPHTAGNDPSPEVAWQAALDLFEGRPRDSDLLSPPFVQLFDLSKDPHEDNNLAADHPERVRQMVQLLTKQVERGRSTPGPELSNDKNVKIVNLQDRRLPPVVRDRVNSRSQK